MQCCRSGRNSGSSRFPLQSSHPLVSPGAVSHPHTIPTHMKRLGSKGADRPVLPMVVFSRNSSRLQGV